MDRKLTGMEARSLAELVARKNSALSFFRPQPHQDAIFTNKARELLILGGNRSGKTTCACVLFAAMAMDAPVTLSDGTQVEVRRPHQKGKCIRMWIVAYDQKHIGQTLYRSLFSKGLFDIIEDEETQEMRAYRRWDPKDKARESQKREAPPLIPSRCVDPKSWVFESLRMREFTKVIIVNPVTKVPTAEVFAYSSKGDPKQGDPVDVVFIDEQLQNPDHYSEYRARILDRNGVCFWASWPALDNDSVYKLYQRCEENAHNPDALEQCVTLTMSGNKALDPKTVKDFLAGCQSEEERLARDQGLFVTEQLRMYPLFNVGIHTAICSDTAREDELSKILRERDGVPPDDWCRDLILDPGTQHPAVLFCAVPPPQYGDYAVVYDEWYGGRADADQLARAVRQRTVGQRFRAFYIDQRAGRQTGMGYGVSVMSNYSRAFAENNLQAALTGSGFYMASTDVGGRIMMLQSWMHIGGTGFPKLRVVTHRCPELCKQVERVKKKIVNKDVKDDRPASGSVIDLSTCLEYWAAARPTYQRLAPSHDEGGPGYARYMKMFGSRQKSNNSIQIGTRYRAS